MSDLKAQADKVVEALLNKPALLEEVRSRLAPDNTPRLAYTVLVIEHEFGQRDEGWTLHPTREAALAWKEQHQGPGWSYHVNQFAVTAEVARLLSTQGRLGSKGNHEPTPGTTITIDLIRLNG